VNGGRRSGAASRLDTALLDNRAAGRQQRQYNRIFLRESKSKSLPAARDPLEPRRLPGVYLAPSLLDNADYPNAFTADAWKTVLRDPSAPPLPTINEYSSRCGAIDLKWMDDWTDGAGWGGGAGIRTFPKQPSTNNPLEFAWKCGFYGHRAHDRCGEKRLTLLIIKRKEVRKPRSFHLLVIPPRLRACQSRPSELRIKRPVTSLSHPLMPLIYCAWRKSEQALSRSLLKSRSHGHL
jgi:hypothetical protein